MWYQKQQQKKKNYNSAIVVQCVYQSNGNRNLEFGMLVTVSVQILRENGFKNLKFKSLKRVKKVELTVKNNIYLEFFVL